jgi:hypothetical protein
VLSVGSLSETDAGVVLVYLDPQVEGEGPQVANLEGSLHLLLKYLHLVILGTGDHQVVNVDTHQQGIAALVRW